LIALGLAAGEIARGGPEIRNSKSEIRNKFQECEWVKWRKRSRSAVSLHFPALLSFFDLFRVCPHPPVLPFGLAARGYLAPLGSIFGFRISGSAADRVVPVTAPLRADGKSLIHAKKPLRRSRRPS